MKHSGSNTIGYVYAAGKMIAEQSGSYLTTKDVSYLYTNPITSSQRGAAEAEYDPMQNPIGLTAPMEMSGGDAAADLVMPRFADALNLNTGCAFDGMPISCDVAGSASDAVSMYSPELFPDKPIIEPTDDPVKPRTTPDPFAAPGSPTTAYASSSRGSKSTAPPRCPVGTAPMKDDTGAWTCAGVGNNFVTVKATSQPVAFSSFLQGKIDKSYPCPPTGRQLTNNRQLRRIFTDLLQNQSGHRTDFPLENGGWIYQYKNGVFFFQPFEGKRTRGHINLSNPPRIRGARMIASVHTHPYTNYDQNRFNEIEGRGEIVPMPSGYADSPLRKEQASGPSEADNTIATNTDTPSLVVFEGVKFGNPAASFWAENLGPDRIDSSNCK